MPSRDGVQSGGPGGCRAFFRHARPTVRADSHASVESQATEAWEEPTLLDKLRRLVRDEAGTEIVEWTVVTLIMIFATYAILLAVGPELTTIASNALASLKGLIGG